MLAIENYRTIFTKQLAVTVMASSMFFAVGCIGSEVKIWMPSPITQWSRLAPNSPVPVSNHYRILLKQPTEGLFPASMAVTRVGAAQTTEDAADGHLDLILDPRNEFLLWNSAFDDQMAVSEVFPIAKQDLGGESVSPKQILRAMSALHAKIGFVYAYNKPSETDAEMIGVLYRTNPPMPLAMIHARETSLIKPKRHKEDLDLRKYEADARVRKKFAKLVHTCLRELVKQDKPKHEDPPPGWLPKYPELPVEWPPYSGQSR